ncbi:MAG: hypothetical protein WA705_07760 [Candidatus Ozemobacteraceae bacterium]
MKPGLPDGIHLAFDLGSNALKAVVIERTAGHDRVASIEEELVRPPGDFPGENEYREHLVSLLKNVAERLPVKTARSIVATFNSRELQVKIVDLPQQVAGGQVENVLSWEAKKLLSPTFRTEPFLYAYRPLRAGGTQFALSVVPLSHLRRFIELFEAVGIHPDGIYPESLTGLAVKDCLATAGLPALSLINVGHLTTHIHIFSGGDLKFYRHIPSGTGEFPDPSQPAEMEVYTQKIRFSFDYFRAVTKLGGIDEIQFLGGGIRRAGFLAYCREYFAPGRVVTLDLSSRFDITPVMAHQGRDGMGLSAFQPALTAFLAHLEASSGPTFATANFRVRLQALEDQERWLRLSRTLPVFFSLAGCAVLVFFFSWWRGEIDLDRVLFKNRLAAAEMSVASLKTKLAQRRSQDAPVAPLPLNERKALAPLLRDRLSAGEVMLKVALSLPENVSLKNFEILPTGVEASEEPEEESVIETSAVTSGSASSTGEEVPGLAMPPSPPFSGQTSAAPVSPTSAGMGGQTGGPAEEVISDLGGEILFLRGTAGNEALFLTFVNTLRKKGVITNFRRIATRKEDGKLRFSVEGELP